MAVRLLHRLEPARWGLEWHLPWWLGHEFGLDPRVSQDLVLGNVLGLASVRLCDDLLDGDLDENDSPAAPALSTVLYEAALDIYRSLFPPASALWHELALRMAEWRTAIGDNAAPSESNATNRDEILRHLARRGSPLRISAFAVCLLAGRTDVYPTLGRCLDHALAAMVLFDHLCDWREDLAAGRWNAFVGAASPHAQTAESRARNRVEVATAMMARDAVAQFVTRIRLELASARTLAVVLQLPALASHFAGLAARIEEHAGLLQARYRKLGEGGAAILLGTSRSASVGIQQGAQPATA